MEHFVKVSLYVYVLNKFICFLYDVYYKLRVPFANIEYFGLARDIQTLL